MTEAINELHKLYNKYFKQLTAEPDKHWEKAETRFTESPPCIKGLLADGVLELGSLNMTQFRLGAYFKSQEVPIAQAIALLDEWAQNIKPSCTHSILRDGIVDIKDVATRNRFVCRTVYSGSQYGFSCAGIKQIPGVDDYCTKVCRDEVETIHTISLFDSTRAEYRHKRISVPAEVVGRQEAVYIIPDVITARCIGQRPSETHCGTCPLYQSDQGVEFKVNAASSNILMFLEAGARSQIERVGKMIGIARSKCGRWKYDMTEQNAEIVWIGPPVTNEYILSERYTRQEAYYIGHGIKTNQTYIMSGYLHPNRKGIATLVFDRAEEAKDSIQEFVFTDKMKEQSQESFAPATNESLRGKHIAIIDALNYNHIYIWGRDDMLIAMDLVFHSVRRFVFQRRLIRGWLDILVIGDSGQGKTQVASALMSHYDLGYQTSAESATRAGLLYGINMRDHAPNYLIWGALPRYTGRLVAIDELGEIIKEGGFSKLTQARSSGMITVDTIVSGRAMSETRLIMLTNPPGRRRLDSYMYPVEAIPHLIEGLEDMRRFDLVVGAATQEVSVGKIHTDIEEIDEIPDIPSDICKNHVLWAWSLQPGDVEISHEVEKHVLLQSQSMCDRYLSDIPIVETADQRDKIIRVSTAIAARMFLEKKGKLIVTHNAVDAAVELMDNLYCSPALLYNEFSEGYAKGILSDADIPALAAEFKNNEDRATIWRKMTWFVMTNRHINPAMLAANIATNRSVAIEALSWLCSYQMAYIAQGGIYMLTRSGIKFFRFLKEAMSGKEDKEEF